MPAIIKQYKDLDLDFIAHPIKEDIVPLTGVDAVKRSVRNIVLLNNFEAPFQPSKGGNVPGMLFENFDPVTAIEIKQKILSNVGRLEKRAKDVSCDVSQSDDENTIIITVRFSVETQLDPVTIQVFLERAR
jgi:phage baseplate assembly protein W